MFCETSCLGGEDTADKPRCEVGDPWTRGFIRRAGRRKGKGRDVVFDLGGPGRPGKGEL